MCLLSSLIATQSCNHSNSDFKSNDFDSPNNCNDNQEDYKTTATVEDMTRRDDSDDDSDNDKQTINDFDGKCSQ